MRTKSTLLLLVVSATVMAPVASGANTTGCPPADPVLAGRPADLPAPVLEQPVRDDPGGARTITVAVEDPSDAASRYAYIPVPNAPEMGLFTHRWPNTSTHIVTVGVYRDIEGVRTRVPVLLIEGGAWDDGTSSIVEAALMEALPLTENALTVGLNTVMPTPVVLASLLSSTNPALGVLERGWFAPETGWPSALGYANRPPLYIWSTYRNAPGADVWQGLVVTHQGWYQSATAGTVTTREACRRTRIGGVARSGAQTTYLGGVFLDDYAISTRDSATKNFSGRQRLTAGTSVASVDVPVTTIEQSEIKEGAGPIPGYARYQRDEIVVGATVGGIFVPLLGTRAEAWHGNGDGQRRLGSIGVYGPTGAYHPVVGYRWRFQYWPVDVWPFIWALTGGPGSELGGDWEADVGVFDATGNFVPVFGTTYDDKFAEAVYRYQMMITAGPWVAGTYQPALGITYDGETPLVLWAFANAGDVHQSMGRWIVSAGTFNPIGGYVPLVGATYGPGVGTPSEPVVEEYRVGVFPASYSQVGRSQFIPVGGANWHSTRTSAAWAVPFATGGGKAPADARVTAGPVVGGTYTPVAEVRATAGRPDRYRVGAYVLGGFVPLAEVCHTHGNYTVGVGTGTGTPLVWAGIAGGSPNGGAFADCPA